MRKALIQISTLLLVGCAQQVAPTGGPKDETPPEILSEVPANLSTEFNSKEIVISFDEFIQLKSASEQVVISPPMLQSPTYQLKQKSLVVKFEQELSPNTTYTINFGEAIRDNNEGNILPNYTYVFSTGTHLDSMEVKGKLVDVLTNEPIKDALVMLYKNDIDSLPLDTIPDYFTRSTETGSFHIKNVADQPFKIFALKDENANYKFDVKEEQIGFLDSLIYPFTPPQFAEPDSTNTDSVALKTITSPIPSIDMKMFVEEDTTQYLKKAYCDYFGKLVFVYNQPMADFEIELEEATFKSQWNLKDFSANRDSISVWTTGVVPDTMSLILTVNQTTIDTVELIMKARKDAVETKKKSSGFGKKKTSKSLL
ncbi:MAG: Ig-like domain-containing protein [Flavobacteriales bacterium]